MKTALRPPGGPLRGLRIGTFLATVLILSLAIPAGAEEVKVGNFSAGDLDGWSPRSFGGVTEYSLVRLGERTVLKADSRGTASGLVKTVNLDPRVHRYLSWSWRVEGAVEDGDCRTEKGDDAAARLLVIFRRTGNQVRVLNYLWANVLPPGTVLPHSGLKGVVMVAVRSGQAQAGRWLTEKRDLAADFKAAFGGEPPLIDALALMTDTDNTGGRATAYYGDIFLTTGSGSPAVMK